MKSRRRVLNCTVPHRTTWHGSIQSVTQFKFWTDFSHGNEVAYSCDQRLFFSSLTQLRRKPSVSIRKKYPLEPRVYMRRKVIHNWSFDLLFGHNGNVASISCPRYIRYIQYGHRVTRVTTERHKHNSQRIIDYRSNKLKQQQRFGEHNW